MLKLKGLRIAKSIWREKRRVGELTRSNSKVYCKKVEGSVLLVQTRKKYQCNWTQSRNRITLTWLTEFLTEEPKKFNKERKMHNKWCWNNRLSLWGKNPESSLPHTICMKKLKVFHKPKSNSSNDKPSGLKIWKKF